MLCISWDVEYSQTPMEISPLQGQDPQKRAKAEQILTHMTKGKVQTSLDPCL